MIILYDPETAPMMPESTAVERIDSGITDESPFGSSLTTPVDEDVQLFPGIEERLLKSRIDLLGSAELATHVGSQNGLSEYSNSLSEAACKTLEFSQGILSRDKLSVIETLESTPTPSPSLTEIYAPSEGTNGLAPVGRPCTGGIYSQPNNPIDVEGIKAQTSETEEHAFEHPDSPTISAPFDDHTTGISCAPDIMPAKEPTFEPLSECSLPDISTLSESTQDLESRSYSAETPNLEDEKTPPTLSADVAKASPILDEDDNLLEELSMPTLQMLVSTILRVVFFLPWCVAVGGTIVLFPSHLEHVAFGPGYVESRRGIRRFAHWADTSKEFVGIFLGLVACIGWVAPSFGLLLFGGIVAQFVHAWQDFVVDRAIPLGEDDRQSIYLVIMDYGTANGLVDIRKVYDRYFISPLQEVIQDGKNDSDDDCDT